MTWVASTLACIALVYLLLWPMAMLVRGSFTGSPIHPFATLDRRRGSQPFSVTRGSPPISAASILLSVSVAIGSVILATFFAVVATRARTGLRGLITPMMVLIAATPGLFYAMSWAMLANPNAGIIPRLLIAAGLTRSRASSTPSAGRA